MKLKNSFFLEGAVGKKFNSFRSNKGKKMIVKLLSNILGDKKEILKTTMIYKIYKFYKRSEQIELSPEFTEACLMINNSENMIDLGCGSHPHEKAKVAVDKYIEPIHRKFGANQIIDVEAIESMGIKFFEADFEHLPFSDKEFDVAYSHHVVEHLDSPEKACKEMQRVAKGGVIMCPSIFSEYMFGRQYHRWLVKPLGKTLVFIEKDWEKPWFGEGPHRENGKVIVPANVNPFDVLLNESNWYHGIHRWKRLSKMLRYYWFGHYSVIETVFTWHDSFDYLIVYLDGRIVSSKTARECYE